VAIVHHQELSGRVLDGKYVLGPVIGQGAIGRVYKARQISLEREVAIKILNPGYANHPEAIARFRLEARAASRIRHPGIVTILDWGKDPEGLLYLVIEYLGGRDLFDIAQKEAPLDSSRIARLVQQVSLALAHAHGEGIIHRDLKPENLRVLEDPAAPLFYRERVKIYDFGVAHVARGLKRVLTQVGVLVGTPYYMSPEQAASAEVLPQSDLYSCGVIMFLLATGTLPFVASSPIDVASMHIKKRPPRPSMLNPEIDPRLEKIILRCLSKDPWERPASGAELADLLEPIARGISHSPAVEGRRERGMRSAFRWAFAWALCTTFALVGLAAAQLAPDNEDARRMSVSAATQGEAHATEAPPGEYFPALDPAGALPKNSVPVPHGAGGPKAVNAVDSLTSGPTDTDRAAAPAAIRPAAQL
jgi:serine/threonine protein kinase